MIETLAIIASALVFSGVSLFVNHAIGGKRRIKQIQKEVNDFQKEMNKAMKEKDEKKIKEMEGKNSEMMGKSMEMLKLQWKALPVILILFFIVIGTSGFLGLSYEGLLPGSYPNFTILLPFDIHAASVFSLQIIRNSTYGVRGFFIVCLLIFGMIFESLYSKIIK